MTSGTLNECYRDISQVDPLDSNLRSQCRWYFEPGKWQSTLNVQLPSGLCDGVRDFDREGYQVKAATDRGRDAVQSGFVIACDKQLESRQVLEKVLAHEASWNLILASQSQNS